MSKSRQKVTKFNLAETIKKSRVIQIEVPGLGLVRYRPLTFNDLAELGKKYPNDPTQISLNMVFKMLAPTNPGLTIETIKMLPWDVVTRLLNALSTQTGYLPKVTEATTLPKGEVKP